MLVTQSYLALCDPRDCSPPGSSVHGILQPRILRWIAIPFSREFSQPRDPTRVSCIAPVSLPSESLGKPITMLTKYWQNKCFREMCELFWGSSTNTSKDKLFLLLRDKNLNIHLLLSKKKKKKRLNGISHKNVRNWLKIFLLTLLNLSYQRRNLVKSWQNLNKLKMRLLVRNIYAHFGRQWFSKR